MILTAFSLAKAATRGNAQDFSAPASKIVLVSAILTIFRYKLYSLQMDPLTQVGVSADNLPFNSAEMIEFNTQGKTCSRAYYYLSNSRNISSSPTFVVLPTCYGSIDDLRSSLQLLADVSTHSLTLSVSHHLTLCSCTIGCCQAGCAHSTSREGRRGHQCPPCERCARTAGHRSWFT